MVDYTMYIDVVNNLDIDSIDVNDLVSYLLTTTMSNSLYNIFWQ